MSRSVKLFEIQMNQKKFSGRKKNVKGEHRKSQVSTLTRQRLAAQTTLAHWLNFCQEFQPFPIFVDF